MLVREIMTKEVVAIGPEMPIGDVHVLMEQRNIRHFPILEVSSSEVLEVSSSRMLEVSSSRMPEVSSSRVLEATPNATQADSESLTAQPAEGGDAKLVGIVSDRDIRAVGSELAKQGVTLKDPVRRIMVYPVLSAHPLDPIEESASVLRQHKIGAMPVMDGEDLVGIVTSTDLLESLMVMTGVRGAASRLEVEVENRPGALARLTEAVAERGVNIVSVLTHSSDDEMISFVLRADTIDGRGLANALKERGFHVLWPPEKGRYP